MDAVLSQYIKGFTIRDLKWGPSLRRYRYHHVLVGASVLVARARCRKSVNKSKTNYCTCAHGREIDGRLSDYSPRDVLVAVAVSAAGWNPVALQVGVRFFDGLNYPSIIAGIRKHWRFRAIDGWGACRLARLR
jgi:hypothetical protein